MKKNKLIDKFIFVLLLLFIIQSPISTHYDGMVKTIFSYLDEVVAIALFAISILYGKLNKIQTKLLSIQLVFLLIGIIGSWINKLQPMGAIIQDIISCSKFIATIIGIMTLYKTREDNIFFDKLSKMIIYIVYIFGILAILDIIIEIPFFYHTNKRFGMYSLQLFYYHPAVLAQVLVMFLAILSWKNDRRAKLAKYICLVMLCMTFRTKAIGFAIIYFLLIWKNNLIKRSGIVKYIIYAFILLGVIFIAQDSISLYYGSLDNSARGIITTNSIKIANNKFPIGAGLGTYGSAAAEKYYSPLYYSLGFKKVYGLGYINNNYLTDTFWPVVLGEFGYLGLVVWIYLCVYFFKLIKNMYAKDIKTVKIILTLYIYLLICSTSSTGFFNPIAVPYAILMGMVFINYQNKCNLEVKNG